MFALMQVADVSELTLVARLVSDGGAVVLLGFIVVFLVKRVPTMLDRLTDENAKAAKEHSESLGKTLETFSTEQHETRSMFRQEQEAARATQTSLLREERAACDARQARIEARLDDHDGKLDGIGQSLVLLTSQHRKDN